MPGLVPGIHALSARTSLKTWMAGTSPAMTRCGSIRSPDLMRQRDDEPELRLLRLQRDRVAFGHAGEAALRADRQAVEIDEAARRLEAALERLLVLQRGSLGRHQSEHDPLVLGQVPQRGEIAGARTVVFEQIERNGEPVEQPLGDRIVPAFGVPGAAAVAP